MPLLQDLILDGGNAVARLLFPPTCPFCFRDYDGNSGRPMLCDRCAVTIAPPGIERCPRCALRRPAGVPRGDDCDRCHSRRPAFERVWTLGEYDDLLRQAVLRGKKTGGQILVAALTRLLLEQHARSLCAWNADLLVPTPLYWMRRLWRGANSPEIIGETLAADLHVSCEPFALRRRRWTRPQSGLPPRERTANVRGAFRVSKRCNLQGARVLLVDDILTSGATLTEMAKIVRAAGATAVATVVLARAEEPL
jgi:ComF family protein